MKAVFKVPDAKALRTLEQILVEASEKKLGVGIDTAAGKLTGVRQVQGDFDQDDRTNAVIGKFPTHFAIRPVSVEER